MNPARETPVLELDDGTLLAQSNAILWYLIAGSSYLPAGDIDRALILQWLMFEQERVMSGIGSTRFRVLTARQADQLTSRFEAMPATAMNTRSVGR
jgi:glutathione S-transferase